MAAKKDPSPININPALKDSRKIKFHLYTTLFASEKNRSTNMVVAIKMIAEDNKLTICI